MQLLLTLGWWCHTGETQCSIWCKNTTMRWTKWLTACFKDLVLMTPLRMTLFLTENLSEAWTKWWKRCAIVCWLVWTDKLAMVRADSRLCHIVTQPRLVLMENLWVKHTKQRLRGLLDLTVNVFQKDIRCTITQQQVTKKWPMNACLMVKVAKLSNRD